MAGQDQLLREIRNSVKTTTALSGTSANRFRISLGKLPSTSSALFGREKELAMLDSAWNNPKTNIISLVAWGGVGKTALVNVWLTQMMQRQYRGAERVYGYSFYSQGAAEGKQTSADLFVATALAWFGDPGPDKGSPWDRGERLADLIKRQRTLLVLDGLEPLQYAPGESGGRIKDPGLQCLLRELARHNPGLCIVTTRLLVDELKDFDEASVEQIALEHLPPAAGAAYLKHLGLKGTDDELREAANEFDGHALALTLLGSYLKIVYEGDVRQRDKIVKLTDEKKQGGHARRIMEAYERWFQGKPELNILYIMGLFDRPVEGAAIEVLRAKPAIEGLTDALQRLSHVDWQYILDNLRAARLLANEDPQISNTIDCHPLLREHFGEKLKAENLPAWKEAHNRLCKHYKSVPKRYPDTVDDMAILCSAIYHGCEAGKYRESLDDIYMQRMNRKRSFLIHELGAPGLGLSALANFFEQRWKKVLESLPEGSQPLILFSSGLCLAAVGRITDALEAFLSSLQIGRSTKNWESIATDAGALADHYLIQGRLMDAFKYAQKALEWSKLQDNNIVKKGAILHLASVLQCQGKLKSAEGKLRSVGIDLECLPSVIGYRYCSLLLDQGRTTEILEVARIVRTNVEDENRSYHFLDKALFFLSLGHAEILNSLKENSFIAPEVSRIVDLAQQNFRQAGQHQFIVLGSLVQSQLFRILGNHGAALRILGHALSIAYHGNMYLYEADCHLEYSRLHLAMGARSKARESWAKARKMIEEMGYHRRDPEIHLLKAQLHLISGEKDKARESLIKSKGLINKMGMHRWDYEVKELEKLVGK